ncbi:MAG: Clp1/GlmU family protein [Candidatus Nitrosocosmicus sp.]|nr:hypothetical protein [Candidatus Nitrosocosmicus sp.]
MSSTSRSQSAQNYCDSHEITWNNHIDHIDISIIMKVIMVKGPIVIDIVGRINIIGAYYKNQKIRWDQHKVLPIEFEDSTEIRFIGKTTSIFATHNLRYSSLRLGTRIWDPIFSDIMHQKGDVILILGSSNSGKSSFSLFLVNKFIKLGLRTLLIDGDIGQGDLAPPTCIGSSIINKQTYDISLIESERICFVGDTQPSGHFISIITSIHKLLKKSRDFDKCIINTDGFVTGKGVSYKFKLAQTLHPDLIIYMGNDATKERLKAMTKVQRNYTPSWLTCKNPSALVKRSKHERYLKRLDTYYRFFKKCKIYKLNLDMSELTRSQIMEKNHINKLGQTNMRNMQLNLRNCQNHIKLKVMINNLKDGQFVGLGKSSSNGLINGFGIINVLENKRFHLYCTSRNFDCIYLSNIILKGMKERLLY